MPQLFANNAASTLASAITSTDTTLTLAAGAGAKFPSPTGSDYFLLTLTQATSETSWEIVKVTARTGDALTAVRAQEGTTALAWGAGDKAELRITAWALDAKLSTVNATASGLTLADGYTESVFSVTGITPALSPSNGSIQTWTLTGDSTPTAGAWNSGQSMTLMIDDGAAFTVSWASMPITWKTGGGLAPILLDAGFTPITLTKVGTVIYGWRGGDA